MMKALLAASIFLIAACSGNTEKADQGDAAKADLAIYTCPMQCEGDKAYEKAGKCPVCKMDLQEVAFYGIDSVKHQQYYKP